MNLHVDPEWPHWMTLLILLWYMFFYSSNYFITLRLFKGPSNQVSGPNNTRIVMHTDMVTINHMSYMSFQMMVMLFWSQLIKCVITQEIDGHMISIDYYCTSDSEGNKTNEEGSLSKIQVLYSGTLGLGGFDWCIKSYSKVWSVITFFDLSFIRASSLEEARGFIPRKKIWRALHTKREVSIRLVVATCCWNFERTNSGSSEGQITIPHDKIIISLSICNH